MRYLFFCLFSVTAFAQEFFQHGDVKIAYQSFGNGIPIIVLNGGPGRSSQTFIPLAKQLAKIGLKVYIFDQRGTGLSKVERNEKNINLDMMVEDLEQFRQHLKLDKFAVLGHSFGGIYAMAYGIKYPMYLSHMVLSASGGVDMSFLKYLSSNLLKHVSPERRTKIKALWKKEEELEKKGKDSTAIVLEVTKLFAPAYIYNIKNLPEIERDLPDPKVNNPAVARLIWKSLEATWDGKGKFRDFKVPTLIIAGRQDFLGEGVPLAIQTNIPGSELLFLNECAHYPWLDAPKDYFAAIQKHLR